MASFPIGTLGLSAKELRGIVLEVYEEAVEARQAGYDAALEVGAVPLTPEEEAEALAQITSEGLNTFMAQEPEAARQTLQRIRRGSEVAAASEGAF